MAGLVALVVATAALMAHAQVVISEIHYHPVEEPAFNADGTPFLSLTNDVHEFVEIQNTGAAAVDLTGWKLAGGIACTFPSNTTIAPGGFRVIAKDPARLASVYGLATSAVLGAWSGQLANGSDAVRLRDAAGTLVDAVAYDSVFPWAGAADALGAQDRFTGLTSSNYQYRGRSLQRVSVTWASGDPANWLASPLTGPTPGAAQAVTRTVPKPVVVAQSAVQATDGAAVVRSNIAVAVNCTFSSATNLSGVTLEYFVDDVNSTAEARTSVTMTGLGGARYSASIPGRPDRSVVRYRFKADRGDGLEVVSPRADDPQIAPVGTNGMREAWFGYFVTPVRTTTNGAIYDVFVSTAALGTLNTNITQFPLRVTAASATGVPRDTPYVAATAPLWDGTQPGVFACSGTVWDIHIRYHGSRYHRAAANNSFKVQFPRHQPYNGQSAWFVTGHGAEFIEAQRLNRLLRLPASKMRLVDWYYNANAMIVRSEQGEYADEMLDEYHDLMQQLNPGSAKEASGELYKVVGNRDASQNNVEGPYTRGDEAPMQTNAGWSQLQRYTWVMALQCNGWKGPKPVRDLVEGMWTARGDSPSTHNFDSNAVTLASARTWFTNNWDIDTTITSMALLEWMSIWDDACQNHFFWRRASGRWSRLGWDYDSVMFNGTGGLGGGTNQTIYGGEYGAPTVFDGVNWWKDTFYKCYRTEYQKRLWELANSFCDPTNLTVQGFTRASAFAVGRRAYVNAQLSALGTYYKPARPTNAAPPNGSAILSATNLTTSAYAHPQATPHGSTTWEIRTAAGDYESPVVCLTSAANKTALPVPFDQLVYGGTYYWRATHLDTNGHPSIVSAETSFTWGAPSTNTGTVVLNEVLAFNRNAAQNGNDHPDYVELRNNSGSTVSLTGWTLSDDPLAPGKYAFPTGTTLAASARLLVWCDSNTNTPGLHTMFGLNSDGDEVFLLNGGTLVDSVAFGPQAPDVSIGRMVDGTGGWQANTPTPSAANIAKTLGATTALRINEWMVEPAYGDDWFEIHNTDSNVVALAGLWLSDTPTEPAITRIPALSFIEGGGFTRFYADGSDAGGAHANFKLGNSGESLVLSAANGVTAIDTVTFGAQPTDVAQGRLPDGAGTIVAFPSKTASPGWPNWSPAAVQIGEVLANASPPFEDAIELANPGVAAVDVGGWWLSDDLVARKKYRIPDGTVVPAGGTVVVYEGSLAGGAVPFSLAAAGDEVVLSAVDGAGNLTGYGALVRFGASATNASFGRVEATGLNASSGGAEFWPQAAHTFGRDAPADVADFRTGSGLANAAPLIGPVTINEIMYHPPDGTNATDNTRDEFVEVHNVTTNAVDLGGWRFKGDAEYAIPSGTFLAAGGYLLLVGFNPTDTVTLAAFRTNYALTAATPILGPWSQKLANDTFDVELARPATVGGYADHLLVDKVEYRDIAPWPVAADGTGASLQRTSGDLIGNTATNWAATVPTPGAANTGVLAGVTIGTAALPGGVTGVVYSVALTAAGGTAPYAWSLSAGAVPGLAFTSAGALTGTPTVAGSYALTFQVTDHLGGSATRSLGLTVAAVALSVTTAGPLADGVFGVAYTQTLAAAGGTLPYTWSIVSGALPPGLALGGSGTISGTPSAAGTFAFAVRAADGGGLEATKAFSIFIPVPPLTITSTSPLPDARLNGAYAQALTGVGGIAPYTWSKTAGTLPGGLGLAADGTLSGTPTNHGTFVFAVRLADGASTAVTQAFTLAVVPTALVVTTTTLPDGMLNDAYEQSIVATGGVPPYAWALVSGSLPDGLTMTTAGLLKGTPLDAGAFPFAVRVTDNAGTSTPASVSLAIAASGPLDHFAWDYVPTNAYAGEPFAVKMTARDASDRVVADLTAAVPVSAAAGAGGVLASPVLITEMTDGGEDQFELENMTSNAVTTLGWFVLIGDSLTDINTMNAYVFFLPETIAAGELLRVSELNTAGRLFFGGPIGWSSSAGANTKGWIMLFDAQYNLRDFLAVGWTAAQLATLSVEVNGNAMTVAGQWTGDGALPGTRAGGGTTMDSWQRIGSADTHSATNWAWRHNTNNTDATSFGTNNTGLAHPWTTAVAVPMTPTNLDVAVGEFLGRVTITQAVADVRMTADDKAGHAGTTAAFTVLPWLDSDGDGMPDAWEAGNGLATNVSDAAVDSDGDGMPNLQEYRANTNPRSAASRLAITGTSLAGPGRLAISWYGAAGKIHRIDTCGDFANWLPLDTRILVTAGGPQVTTLAVGVVTSLFLRVEAESDR